MSLALKVEKAILVVDDEPSFVSELTAYIEDSGFPVEGAFGGLEALKKLEKSSFSLIILDLRMPRVDGYDVLEILKSNPLTRNIPVIVVTAVSDTQSLFRTRELGSVDYLIKPFDPKQLISRIKELIS